MIIFFTALCAFISMLSLIRIYKIEEDISNLDHLISLKNDNDQILTDLRKKFNVVKEENSEQFISLKNDIITRFVYIEEELLSCSFRLDTKIDDKFNQLIYAFQVEKIELEKIKSNRTKDTFKSLQAAFSPVTVEKDDK